MTTVGLPMYDLPELRPATDALWRGLARAFRRAGIDEVPDGLERASGDDEPLTRPDLLFSQTCGYPLVTALKGVVRLVATPCYDVPGCAGPNYTSAIIARADDPGRALADFRGRVGAINGTNSQSGYNTLRHSLAPLAGGQPFFSRVIETGGHLFSMNAVARGNADLAAVDCVTFALIGRTNPAAVAGLKVVAWSAPAPSLPFVTRAGADEVLVARLRDGLAEAFADPALKDARAQLSLSGFEVLESDAYDCILEMERTAVAQGFERLV